MLNLKTVVATRFHYAKSVAFSADTKTSATAGELSLNLAQQISVLSSSQALTQHSTKAPPLFA